MSARADLTRWNRAGKQRFEYVNGNAVEYLEILRERLARHFSDPDTGRCEWLNPPDPVPVNELEPPGESLIERQLRLSLRQERLLESYGQQRRDWGWEIARVFARACHVLTEHTNAHANEAFLGTATQWENVRKLVALLDYYPAPPASATTTLVFTSRGSSTATVRQGFQVKHSPPGGAPKIIFETLQDLMLDPALDAMRPKAWDQSEEPAAEAIAPAGGLSALAMEPATLIRGVGPSWSLVLNSLPGIDTFRILDFRDLDPSTGNQALAGAPLRDWKTKADLILDFSPVGDWSSIEDMPLSQISESSVEQLRELSGNTPPRVEAMQWDVDALSVCLVDEAFGVLTLKALLPIPSGAVGIVKTAWYQQPKPKVAAGELVMVYRKRLDGAADEAEAGRVAEVEEESGRIHLQAMETQQSWPGWTRAEAWLKISPRWKRKAWLNGNNVLRTREPHGLTADAYVGWKDAGKWLYARVDEADKLNLRLDYGDALPGTGTELFALRPLEGDIVADGYEVVVVLAGPAGEDLTEVSVEAHEPAGPELPDFSSVFTLAESLTSEDGAVLSIPLLPPGGLPDIGSFLIPSPFLPVDLVKAAVKLLLKLGIMQIPSTGEPVFEGIPPEGLEGLAGMLTDLQAPTMTDGKPDVDAAGEFLMDAAVTWAPDVPDSIAGKAEKLLEVLSVSEDAASALLDRIKDDLTDMGPPLVIRKDADAVGEVAPEISRYVFDGSPDKIDVGDWVIAEAGGDVKALRITTIEELSDVDDSPHFALEFEGFTDAEWALRKIYADFRGTIEAEAARINLAAIDGELVELESDVSDSLSPGDELLLTAEGETPVLTTVQEVTGDAIRIDPPASGFRKGQLVIRGNVVRAGHGETRPAKILGSGDATMTNQSFVLKVPGVSFTPDASMSSGVAAAIDVEVAGEIWKQVSTLNDSAPGDAHYAVRMTEDGYVRILFGDGEYGRRLPSGKNNLRVSYRVGAGLAGNLPAGSLEKPVKPNPLVDAVYQPQASAGGGDMEDASSLRENAPASLLALQRAVSLPDFANLAMSRSNVWQARARHQIRQDSRTEAINVIVVPAGGADSSEMRSDLRRFLQAHCLPGVQVSVDTFTPLLFDLKVTVRVNLDAFLAEQVRRDVTAALSSHFTLQRRKLGEPLYLSEVIKVVEAVKGVENSICVLDQSAELRVIKPATEATVIYLDPEDRNAPSELLVKVEGFLP